MASPSSARKFEDSLAVRKKVPLFTGIVGASGSGKTKSALRLAAGMQRVFGGDVYGIDSESNRMLHYADDHKFRHVPFGAPFDPLSYLAAVEHCVKRGATVIVVDSGSHLHEGPGGILEMHETELTRIAGNDWDKRNRCTMLAWQKPKAELRRFINAILQMNVNIIFCYRAKPKLKMVKGADPVPLGYMPIASPEMVYEATANILLYPNSAGVPTWQPTEIGEKEIVKLPGQFIGVFKERRQLDESIGEALAQWALGSDPAPASPPASKTPPTPDRPWMKRLQAAVGKVLDLGPKAEARGLKGEAREQFIRGERLMYFSWCAGREINSTNDLTDEEAAVVIRRSELGEVP